MDKLFTIGGITLGSAIGAYMPVWLFNQSPFGMTSVLCGIFGSVTGLWIGYKLYTQMIE